MRHGHASTLIMPALDEALVISGVLESLPDWLDRVIVVDNGSTDETAMIAMAYGADVVSEPQHGYGAACLAGMSAVTHETSIIIFLDADGSDDPTIMTALVDPIAKGQTDLVLGQRCSRAAQTALSPQQRYGNWFACALIRWLFGSSFSDLGPFRAIRHESLNLLGMRDQTYGWTVEMQVRAILAPIRWQEVSVPYRRSVRKSKISGTVRGVLGAGWKIISTIIRLRIKAA